MKYAIVSDIHANPAAFNAVLDATAADLMFVGHTHDAKIWILSPDGELDVSRCEKKELQSGYRYIVDVGSVGYPRCNSFSSYALFDSCTASIELRRLDFDYAGYVTKFIEKGISLPTWLDRKKMLGGQIGKRPKP